MRHAKTQKQADGGCFVLVGVYKQANRIIKRAVEIELLGGEDSEIEHLGIDENTIAVVIKTPPCSMI